MTNDIKKIKEVLNRAAQLGIDAAAVSLDIQSSTIERYYREARSKGIEISKPEPGPKILIFDLENAPSKAAIWRMWKQDIHNNQITEEWYMLSWAAKWLFDIEIYSDVLTPTEAEMGNDKRIMESLWDMVDAADILVGHNILGFDIQKMNTRFAVNGLIPPSPYRAIDTLYQARKIFSFTSNKLDYLCQQFGLARKADNGGMERWIGCTKGNDQDLLDMQEYNEYDIPPTEELYLTMLPWMRSHPNIALYMDNQADSCYKCGSIDIKWLYTSDRSPKCWVTSVNKYPIYRCNQCHSVGRSPHSVYGKGERKFITNPLANQQG